MKQTTKKQLEFGLYWIIGLGFWVLAFFLIELLIIFGY